jgi:NADH-quinone oxidoreductase subunit J
MTVYALLFYVIAAVILVASGIAITRENLVHAVVYVIISFFGSAMLFYLFGAPLLAALEVIIYAGAVMVLFLFIIMMLKVEAPEERIFPVRQWLPAAGMGLIYAAVGAFLVATSPEYQITLETGLVTPANFAQYLFERHWLSIEIISLLLLIALVGALYLGKGRVRRMRTKTEVEE